MNPFVCLRILVGSILLVAGVEKVLGPYQNFQYVIQGYKIIPDSLEAPIAIVFPWVELFIGLFCVLGLWTRKALLGTLGCYVLFLLIVGQALLRRVPLDECGCFGELVSLPPWSVFIMDSCLFFITLILIRKIDKAAQFSLDSRLGE